MNIWRVVCEKHSGVGEYFFLNESNAKEFGIGREHAGWLVEISCIKTMDDYKETTKLTNHIHLCLKCQMPYSLYYNDVEPDIIYKCERCEHKRAFGKCEIELENELNKLKREFEEAFIEPMINRLIEIAKEKGLIK